MLIEDNVGMTFLLPAYQSTVDLSRRNPGHLLHCRPDWDEMVFIRALESQSSILKCTLSSDIADSAVLSFKVLVEDLAGIHQPAKKG